MAALMTRLGGTWLAAALFLSFGLPVAGLASDAEPDHEISGRFSLTSEAGGAIWAFQPGGLLVLTGPGDISSRGTWQPAVGERDFDATVDYDITGQVLTVKGQVAPDGGAIAVYVQATEPEKPDDAEPWPAESRLMGQRLGMVAQPTPGASLSPVDCLRPRWIDGEIDWDRCGEPVVSPAASVVASPPPGASPSPEAEASPL